MLRQIAASAALHGAADTPQAAFTQGPRRTNSCGPGACAVHAAYLAGAPTTMRRGRAMPTASRRPWPACGRQVPTCIRREHHAATVRETYVCIRSMHATHAVRPTRTSDTWEGAKKENQNKNQKTSWRFRPLEQALLLCRPLKAGIFASQPNGVNFLSEIQKPARSGVPPSPAKVSFGGAEEVASKSGVSSNEITSSSSSIISRLGSGGAAVAAEAVKTLEML